MVLFQRVGYNNTTTIKHQTNKIHILRESKESLTHFNTLAMA